MNLDLNEEQELLRDTFAELFAAESSPERVRAAEPQGFDPALWKTLVETGAVGMRVPEALGGSGAGLFESVLIAEQVGRHLASAPLLESIAACAALAACEAPAARPLLERTLAGDALVVLAPRAADDGQVLAPGGAVADAVLGLDGDDLVLVQGPPAHEPAHNLGAAPVARRSLREGPGVERRDVLASGAQARACFERAVEEWRLLAAAALSALGRRAVEIAAEYATERIQFDRPIGAFQGVAHPLADAITNLEGARLLVWDAVCALGEGRPEAGALIPLAFAWASESTGWAVRRALHTHGGYGLSLEYDIQLYQRRGKAWALTAGDPQACWALGGERLWCGAGVALPDPGEVTLDFGLGSKAEAYGREVRRFFEENLTDELRAAAQYDWDGHRPDFHKKMAEAGVAFASWPVEYGGQGRDPFEVTASMLEFERAGWTTHPISTTQIIGESLLRFGSDELKREVIPRITAGDAVVSMGYTEPASGSDVAAAQTRAEQDGDEWVINGQKMFTSGGNVSQYIFLLTRTDPDAPKHRGLTMFLVPTDTPGFEAQAIHTLSDERTNATYYTDLRISDAYRVGDLNAGWAVLAHALEIEHGAGGAATYGIDHRRAVEATVDWAQATRRGKGRAIDDPAVHGRLARTWARARISWLLSLRGLWNGAQGRPDDQGQGPMVKLFGAEAYIADSADLMDLAAPDSILRKDQPGAAGDGEIEFAYRLSTATAIYGGTSEIMRSIIAQQALGMPRSRS